MKPSNRNTRTVPKTQAAKPPTYTSTLGLTSYLALQLPKGSECQLSLIYLSALILLTLPIFIYVRRLEGGVQAPHHQSHTPTAAKKWKAKSIVIILIPQFIPNVHPKWLAYRQEGIQGSGSRDYHLRPWINAHRNTGYWRTWVHNPRDKFQECYRREQISISTEVWTLRTLISGSRGKISVMLNRNEHA